MKSPKVYLSGGFHSEWRSKVKESLEGFSFFDPSTNRELKLSLAQAGVWSKHSIKQSDIVLAYFEKTNPSGFGLACEMSYAFARGKTVVFVMEPNDLHKASYISFMMNFATITFENLDEAISFVSSLGE